MRQILCAILMGLVPAPAALAVTHYANAAVETSGNGTVGSPWKTMDDVAAGLDAITGDGAGDRVEFADGNYGKMNQAFWGTAKTDWVTLHSTNLYGAVIDSALTNNVAVSIAPAAMTNVYLKLDGFKIEGGLLNPMPSDTDHMLKWKNGADERIVVYAAKARHLQFLNCEVTAGTYRWLWMKAMVLGSCDDLTVQGCLVHGVAFYGINFYGEDTAAAGDINIIGNQVYDIPIGGGIVWVGKMAGTIIIDRNHVYDFDSPFTGTGIAHNEHYLPYNERTAPPNANYHQSSNIGVRVRLSQDVEAEWTYLYFRRNLIHHSNSGVGSYRGGSQGLFLYDLCGKFNAMTFESNWFCQADGGYRWENLYPTADRPVIFRNNTFSGSHAAGSNPNLRTDIVKWWGGCGNPELHSSTSDYTHLYWYNNLVRSKVTSGALALGTGMNSGNNIMYAPYVSYSVPGWKAATDIFATWQAAPPSYALQGNGNFFGDIGMRDQSNTPQYNYTTHGVPTLFTDADHHDFTLSGNSVHMGSDINPGTYGDPATQSPYSFGTIDADGFILDDGQARDADHHSVGAYEAGASFGYPVRPVRPSPFNQEFGIPEGRVLSWDIGLGAVSYNVYLSTDRALVASRDASVKRSTEQTVLTFTPASALTLDSTYYWAVDSVGATGLVGNGVIWQFDTEPSPPGPPAKAFNPSPAEDVIGTPGTVTLSWTAGDQTVTGYDVWFGTTEAGMTKVASNQAGTTLARPGLGASGNYYWRVDSINTVATTTGDVWHFGMPKKMLILKGA